MLKQPHNLQTLSASEFERLGAYLACLGASALSLEGLDGYFAALICGPDQVSPSEYLSQVLGPDHGFGSDEQASDISSLLTCHWNSIACTLHQALTADEVYLPVLQAAPGLGREWACGFLRGLQSHASSWQALRASKLGADWLEPVFSLAREDDAGQGLRPAIADDKRAALLSSVSANLTQIYRHFEPARLARVSVGPALTQPLRRSSAKLGRNQVCSCGSAKKYKHCCGG